MIYFVKILTNKNRFDKIFTGWVSRVDDAQGSGVAVAPGLIHGALQLADVQTPALFLIQVIVDLHGAQFGQRGRVEGILRYGDHDASAGRTLATHQQLQHGLKKRDREVEKDESAQQFYHTASRLFTEHMRSVW